VDLDRLEDYLATLAQPVIRLGTRPLTCCVDVDHQMGVRVTVET